MPLYTRVRLFLLAAEGNLPNRTGHCGAAIASDTSDIARSALVGAGHNKGGSTGWSIAAQSGDLIRNLYERLESDGSVTKNSERGAMFLLGVRQEADSLLFVAAGARAESK